MENCSTKSSSNITIWKPIFSELDEAENKLYEAIDSLETTLNSTTTTTTTTIPVSVTKSNSKTEIWKNLHSQISKHSKTIEKNFAGYNFESNTATEEEGQVTDLAWKDAIAESLIRDGFTFEMNFSEKAQKHKQVFAQLSNFLSGFSENVESVFNWVKFELPESEEREYLLADLINYLFCRKLRKNDFRGGLELLKCHISEFKNTKNQKLINRLLTKSLFTGKNSLLTLEPPSIEILKETFVKLFCKFTNIPSVDALNICNEVGTKSIPVLDRLNTLVKGKNYDTLTKNDELPIELPVEDDFIFHSIFSCPVLKQQSSEENPAFLLPCGHALSKEALNRLSKGNSLVRFKCPYCPTETNFSNCTQLYF